MLRTPRLNPRPSDLHENPSGLAVAAVVGVLGIVGTGGYLVYKTKAATEKYKKDFQDALGTVYGMDDWLIRLLPGGVVQYLRYKKGDVINGVQVFSITGSPQLPITLEQGKEFSRSVKGAAELYISAKKKFVDERSFPGYRKPGTLKMMEVKKGSIALSGATKEAWQAVSDAIKKVMGAAAPSEPPYQYQARSTRMSDFIRSNTFVLMDGKMPVGLQFSSEPGAPGWPSFLSLRKSKSGALEATGGWTASVYSPAVVDEVMLLLQDAQESVSDMPPKKGLSGKPAKAVDKVLAVKILAALKKDASISRGLEREAKEWAG